MRHVWKLLALAIALALMCMGAALAEEGIALQGDTPLTLGQAAETLVNHEDMRTLFSFTPTESTTFVFTAKGESGVCLSLCDADLTPLVSAEGYECLVERELQAGQLYYVALGSYPTDEFKPVEVEVERAYSTRKLTLGEQAWDVLACGEDEKLFAFAPENTDEYSYYSMGVNDTCARLYDRHKNLLAESDNDGFGKNFLITYTLQAGEIYYFGAGNGAHDGMELSYYHVLERTSGSTFGVTPLTVGQTAQADIASMGMYAYFSFTPDSTETYCFSSYSDGDTFCSLYDADMNRLTEADDEGENGNFWLGYTFEAGETYYFRVGYHAGDTGTFDVVLTGDNHLTVSADGDTTFWIAPEGTQTLSVAAMCDRGGIHYQWYLYDRNSGEWTAVEGATDSSFTTPPVLEDVMYECRVTDDFEGSESVAFIINLETHMNVGAVGNTLVYVPSGGSATLQVQATCDVPLSYQWYAYNDPCDCAMWHPISGAMSDTLVTGPIQGYTQYYCRVSDGYGNSTQVYFDVYLEAGFTILTESQEVTTEYGETAELTVEYESTGGEPHFQWYRLVNLDGYDNFQILDDMTSNTITTVPVTGREQYFCRVIDDYGQSRDIYFWVMFDNHFWYEFTTAGAIYVEPGECATLAVNAGCVQGEVHFQWRKAVLDEAGNWVDTVDIEGANASTYTTEPVNRREIYEVYVRDDYDHGIYMRMDVSPRNNLSIHAPGYSGNTVTREVPAGGSVTLEVEVYCEEGDVALQWYGDVYDEARDEMVYGPIEGATGYSYTVENVTEAMQITCYATDMYGNQEGMYFHLQVENGFIADAVESDVRVPYGAPAELEVAASCNSGEISYRWQRQVIYPDGGYDWQDIEGETGATLRIESVTGYESYACSVSDSFGSDTWLTFTVGVDNALTAEPENGEGSIYAAPGETLTLKVVASCAVGEPAYAWHCEYWDDNGYHHEKLNSDTDELVIESIVRSATYCCEVTDQYGAGIDVNFYIYVDNELRAYNPSEDDIYVLPGESATLEVEASCRHGELSYQWRYYDEETEDYVEIGGATESRYTVENIQRSMNYDCRVSDEYGAYDYAYFSVRVDTGFGVSDSDRDVFVPYGETAQLEVDAFCDLGGITYSWGREGETEDGDWFYEAIEGADGPSLTTAPITRRIQYYCAVRDEYGNIRHVYFHVGVENGFSAERGCDRYQAFKTGETVTISVIASSNDNDLTYEWSGESYDPETDGWTTIEIDDTVTDTLVIGEEYGQGDYSCSVSDSYGNSAYFWFEVQEVSPLTVYAGCDQLLTPEVGDNVTLSVVVEPEGEDYVYSWYIDGEKDEEADGPTCTIEAIDHTTRAFCVVASNGINAEPVTFLCLMDEPQTLREGEPVEITQLHDAITHFTFTPAQTGEYTLSLTGSGHAALQAFDADRHQIDFAEDNDGELSVDITAEMEAGEQYNVNVQAFECEHLSLLLQRGEGGFDESRVEGTIWLRPGQTVSYPSYESEDMSLRAYDIRSNDESVVRADSEDTFTAVSEGTALVKIYTSTSYFHLYRVNVADDTSFTLPRDLSEIDSEAFAGVEGLEFLELGANVTHVGTDAFNGSGLKQILVDNPSTVFAGAALRGTNGATLLCTEGSRAAAYAQHRGLFYLYLR